MNLTAGAYAITIASPPIGSSHGFNGSTQDFETKAIQTSTNSLGKVVGQGTSTDDRRLVAGMIEYVTMAVLALHRDVGMERA